MSPPSPESPDLSHLDAAGRARMVDVSAREPSLREAEAEARVRFPAEVFERVLRGDTPKGAVLETARLAGIQAAKRTWELIPLCHPLPLGGVEVEIGPASGEPVLVVRCRARLEGRTGVEMEALTGASVAALTLYDMAKALSKDLRIESIRLLRKSGGKSGEWRAQ